LLNDLDNSLITTPKIFLIIETGEKSKEIKVRLLTKLIGRAD
jgi:hypothetical protein